MWSPGGSDDKQKGPVVDFDGIDDSRDHCVWLSEQLDKNGGKLTVHYCKMTPAEKQARHLEEERRHDLAELERLKKKLGV